MKQIESDQGPAVINSSDMRCEALADSTRKAFTYDQTQDLIMSIVEAVQAGIDGLPELRDQLIRDAELRYASAK
jgi:hypothetical protein